MISDRDFEEGLLEEEEWETAAVSRMRNLMWAVSGNYSLDTKLDITSFRENRFVPMLDAVKQGSFAKYFSKDRFALYIAKKIYSSARQEPLTQIAQLCVEAAVYPFALRERPGTEHIRMEAYQYLLDHRFGKYMHTHIGKIRLAFMKGVLTGNWDCEGRIRIPLEKVKALLAENYFEEPAETPGREQILARTDRFIRTVDDLYNTVADPSFEQEHGDLQKVLEVTIEEMREYGWRNFLEEEAAGDLFENFVEQVTAQVTTLDLSSKEEPSEEEVRRKKGRRIIQVDEQALAKMHSYMELNFGKSYLREQERKAVDHRLCRGAHVDCSLYYTEGIIHNSVRKNAQYVNAVRHARNNERLFLNNRHLIEQSIDVMSGFIKRSLQARTQTEQTRADHGNIDVHAVWKIGRTEDPGKMFYLTTKQSSNSFAVEILIDASGSQRERQGQVALQAYIIAASLSRVKIPHQIMSFCTFWDYTVMQRFRDFDDPPSSDRRVLEFTTSSNNRDGLAVRAAGDSLTARPEENRILIVLSDGRPNDIIVNRPGSRNPRPYYGEYAVKDTAFEIRTLRSEGVCVLGVFTGKEQDLAAEKKIFGKDFAYIRDIRNFSRVVSTYLIRLMEQDTGEAD